eukprot:1325012-Pyramimonas_sp.AAC.1
MSNPRLFQVCNPRPPGPLEQDPKPVVFVCPLAFLDVALPGLATRQAIGQAERREGGVPEG